jgi:hypothetical protein
MTTKIIYIAEDGEEFETSDECLKYEKKRDVRNAVIMFDSNRLPIVDTDSVTAFEDSNYLYIIDAEKAKVFFDYVSDAYCLAIPNLEEVENHALFAYDYNYDSSCQNYINVNDKIAELEVLRDELLDRARECITDMYKGGDDK